METIRQTVQIAPDHTLHLDITVPASVPTGAADVVLLIASARPAGEGESLANLAGILAGSPTFSRDPVKLQRELRDEWN